MEALISKGSRFKKKKKKAVSELEGMEGLLKIKNM
jgi:hypothetical protein